MAQVPPAESGFSNPPLRQEDPNAVSQYIDNVKAAPEAQYIFMDMVIKESIFLISLRATPAEICLDACPVEFAP